MNENNELLEYIYEDASMGTYTLTELLRDLEGKDNKIKKTVENILKGYERYLEEVTSKLEQSSADMKPIGTMTKMGARMGIMKEVISDNSDASIADMLIKGISMGTIDMEKRIHNYKEDAKKEYLKFAEDFYAFQQDNLESLKKYL